MCSVCATRAGNRALRDKGHVRAGQKVLINGAASGVGTFAVQLARAFGAEVTGVCSTRNVEMVRSTGADHVVDYTLDDYTRTGQVYDLIIDMVGNHTLAASRRALAPRATLVGVGGPDNGNWVGPLSGPVKMLLTSPLVSQKLAPMLAQLSRDDLGVLRKFLEEGKVIPVIDRTYPLSEVPAAIRYLEERHARGKVVITV
jgi:NADPH:quinone reductase-like Zn-dependent oxidoreductase